MTHFAQIDQFNQVIFVEVVDDFRILDENGNENEELGVQYLKSLYGNSTNWIQTAFNNNFRCRYAGTGMIYNSQYDVFLYSQPYPSWILNTETYEWDPPIPEPELTEEQIEARSYYEWNEETVNWELKTQT